MFTTSADPEMDPEFVRPPFGVLAVGAVVALASLVFTLPWAAGFLVWPFLGWLFTVAGSVGGTSVFLLRDLERRATGFYVGYPGVSRALVIGLLVLGLVLIVVHGVAIADAVARSSWVPRSGS